MYTIWIGSRGVSDIHHSLFNFTYSLHFCRTGLKFCGIMSILSEVFSLILSLCMGYWNTFFLHITRCESFTYLNVVNVETTSHNLWPSKQVISKKETTVHLEIYVWTSTYWYWAQLLYDMHSWQFYEINYTWMISHMKI